MIWVIGILAVVCVLLFLGILISRDIERESDRHYKQCKKDLVFYKGVVDDRNTFLSRTKEMEDEINGSIQSLYEAHTEREEINKDILELRGTIKELETATKTVKNSIYIEISTEIHGGKYE